MAGTPVSGELRISIQSQLYEIGRQVWQPGGYPYDPNQLRVKLQELIEGHLGVSDIKWGLVYEKLGMVPEFTEFMTGLFVEDNNSWSMPVLKGVTANRLVKAFQELGVKVSLYIEDLDGNVPTNDRDPAKGSYIVRFKRTVEADPENAGQSANDRKGSKDITLTERLLLELGYFLTTGQHLDVENVTLCAGSRLSVGGVPLVYWPAGGRALCVHWCYPDSRGVGLRARAVVS